MTLDLSELSLTELHDLLAKTQQALSAKQKQERKAVIAQMQALAATIGATVTLQAEAKPTTRGNPNIRVMRGNKA